LLSLFRRNLFINIIFLVLFAVGLQLKYYLDPTPTNIDTPLFPALGSILSSSPYFQTSVSILLLVMQAVIISKYITVHRLSRALSTIPGAIFILFVSSVLEPENFNVILLANLFFVLSIGSLFKIYKQYQPIATMFNSGFLLGLATIFYYPYILMFVALAMGLYNLRNFDFKEFLQLFFGFLSCLFLVGVYAYSAELLDVYKSIFTKNYSLPAFDFSNSIILIKPGLCILTIVILIGMQNVLRKKKKFDSIRKIELTYAMFLLGLISIFFIDGISEQHLIVVSFPISVIGGMVLERKEYIYVKEFIFLFLIGLYLAMTFGYL